MNKQKAGGRLNTAPGISAANRSSLCFECSRGGGLCSWSQRFEPVPGWTAEKISLRTQRKGKARQMETYRVIDCPGYARRS